MPIFSIKFSFMNDDVIFRKSAVVRASNPDSAKSKLSDSLLRLNSGKPFDRFAIESISVSSFNYMFI